MLTRNAMTPWARCQHLDVVALLNAGVRILDIRLAMDVDGAIRVSQGVPFNCNFFYDVLCDGVLDGFLGTS